MRSGLRRAICGLFLLALAAPIERSEAQGIDYGKKKALFAAPIARSTVKRALVIGAGDYRWAPPLDATVKDANDFATFLKREWGFPEEAVVLMTDDAGEALRPTGANLRAQVQALLDAVTPESEIVVFFSGHGAGDGEKDWLIPLDGQPADVAHTSITTQELMDGLSKKQPAKAVFFFDACRNLEPGKSLTIQSSGFGLQPTAPRQPELAVMYACDTGEISREGRPRQFRQGVFTHFLLEGLAGDREAARKDGNVTFDTLRQYVRGKVSQYVADEFGASQNPVGKATDGSMVLARAVEVPPRARVAALEDGSAERLVNEAYQYLYGRGFAQAAAMARRALALDADNARAHFILGSVYLEQKQYDDAIAEYTDARRMDQNLFGLRENLDRALKAKAEAAGARRSGSASPLRSSVLTAALFLAPSSGLALVQATFPEGGDSDAARLADEALRALTDDRIAEAEIHAREALARAPENATAYFVLGRVAARRERLDDALREFQEALLHDPALSAAKRELELTLAKKGPADAGRLANEAFLLVQEDRFAEGEPRAREAIARNPESAKAHYALGRVYLHQERHEDAIRECEQALRLDPTLVAARAAREEARKAQAERRVAVRAEAAYRQALAGHLTEAKAAAEEVLRGQPDNGLAYFVLGRFAQSRQQYGEAIRDYEEALRFEPGLEAARAGRDLALEEQGRVDVARLAEEARQQLTDHQFAEAELRAREVLARAPGNATAHFVLGRIAAARGRYDEAISEFQEALRVDPALAAASDALELARKARGRAEAERLTGEARVHLAHRENLDAATKARAAIDQDGENATAHAVLGNALLWLDQGETGEQEIARALQLAPQLPLAHVGEGTRLWLEGFRLQSLAQQEPLRGRERGRRDREARHLYQQAEAEFKTALALDANDVVAHNNLGATYYMQATFLGEDRLADAEREYRAAIERDREFPAAYYNLGNIYLAERQWARAEDAYRRAIQLYAENAGFHAALAAALLKQGNRASAEAEAQEARRLGLKDHFVYNELNRTPPDRERRRGDAAPSASPRQPKES